MCLGLTAWDCIIFNKTCKKTKMCNKLVKHILYVISHMLKKTVLLLTPGISILINQLICYFSHFKN